MILVAPSRFVGKPLLAVVTLIGGETRPNDLTITCDGLAVGRITLVTKTCGRTSWDWSLTGPYIPPQMAFGNGSSPDKELAKADMRVLWDMWIAWATAQGGVVAWHN